MNSLGQRRERAVEFVAAYGRELGPSEAEHWFNEYAIKYHNAWALHDDALPCLDDIGDRLHTDAIDAVKAGLAGVWLDRDGTATEEDLAAAAESDVTVIRSLDEFAPQLMCRA